MAALIEAAFGYPEPLYRAIRHPVTWMGAWLGALESRLNRSGDSFETRRLLGVAALALLLIPVGIVGWALDALASASALGFLVAALVAASLPAQRSLYEHVEAVARALESGSLEDARRAVSKIVGRNPETLDAHAVARAAIESLAENFSDGVVAPLFWTALAGVTGGLLYKAINTADSMIGHHDARFEAFGWAAAKLDDLINLPASRLSALLIAFAAGVHSRADATRAFEAVYRDAARHRSPNAGWPEAAMAGALKLRLAGPRVYGRTRVDDPYMGDGRAEATAADIRSALALYRRACLVLALALIGMAVIARI